MQVPIEYWMNRALKAEKELDEIKQNLQRPWSVFDCQIGGTHYKRFGHMQPWQVYGHWGTLAELWGYAKFTAITYLMRDKEDGQDIQKAIHTLQLYLEVSEQKRRREAEILQTRKAV